MSPPFGLRTRGRGCHAATTDPRYGNQIGPFGGWLAGLAAAAMQAEAPAGWTMMAVSLQFLGRLSEGPIEVRTETLRRQRRIAGVRATLRSPADTAVAVTAEAVFAPAAAAAPAALPARPALPDPATLPRLAALDPLAAFVATFDHRVAFGAPFAGTGDARSGGWLRSRVPLPPGPAAPALLMLADAWYPPRWAALAEPVPVSTVSMQVVFHDADPGSAALDGFFAACYDDAAATGELGLERGSLWWPDGRLALTMQQLTWVGPARSGKEPR